MDTSRYYENAYKEMDNIGRTCDKYAPIIYVHKFFSRFRDIQDYSINIFTIPLHLWKKYKSKVDGITIDDYREEFIKCAGQEKFEQESKQHPDEYEESFLIIQDFILEAEKEYYSGFFGMFRKLRSGKIQENRLIRIL